MKSGISSERCVYRLLLSRDFPSSSSRRYWSFDRCSGFFCLISLLLMAADVDRIHGVRVSSARWAWLESCFDRCTTEVERHRFWNGTAMKKFYCRILPLGVELGRRPVNSQYDYNTLLVVLE